MEAAVSIKVTDGVIVGKIACLYSWTKPPVIEASGVATGKPSLRPTNVFITIINVYYLTIDFTITVNKHYLQNFCKILSVMLYSAQKFGAQ